MLESDLCATPPPLMPPLVCFTFFFSEKTFGNKTLKRVSFPFADQQKFLQMWAISSGISWRESMDCWRQVHHEPSLLKRVWEQHRYIQMGCIGEAKAQLKGWVRWPNNLPACKISDRIFANGYLTFSVCFWGRALCYILGWPGTHCEAWSDLGNYNNLPLKSPGY